MATPGPQSIGPVRIRPWRTEVDLERQINAILNQLVNAIDDRMGFRGQLGVHNDVDMRGHAVRNVLAATQDASAVNLGQLREIEELAQQLRAQLAAMQGLLAGVVKLTSMAPTTIDAGDTAQVGTDPFAAHGQHQHAVNTGVAGDIAAVSTAAAAGASGKLPDAAHVHTIAAAAWASPGAIGSTTRNTGAFTEVRANVLLTANLPAAGAGQDGRIIIEDQGAGTLALVIYGAGVRFRLTGAAF
jgi:hypothetical protein